MPTFSGIHQMTTYGGEFNDIHGSNNRWSNNSRTTNLFNSHNSNSHIATNSHNDLSKWYNNPILPIDGVSNDPPGASRQREGANLRTAPRNKGNVLPDITNQSSSGGPHDRAPIFLQEPLGSTSQPHHPVPNPFFPLSHPFFPEDAIADGIALPIRSNNPFRNQ